MFHASVSAALAKVEQELSRKTAAELKDKATSLGWDKVAASGLNVDHGDVSFEGAEDFEFGTLDRPPLPIARTFDRTSYTDKLLGAVYEEIRGML